MLQKRRKKIQCQETKPKKDFPKAMIFPVGNQVVGSILGIRGDHRYPHQKSNLFSQRLAPPSDLCIMLLCDLMSSTIESVYFYLFLAGEKMSFLVFTVCSHLTRKQLLQHDCGAVSAE